MKYAKSCSLYRCVTERGEKGGEVEGQKEVQAFLRLQEVLLARTAARHMLWGAAGTAAFLLMPSVPFDAAI